MPLNLILMLAAIAAPFLSYGWGVASTTYKVRAQERSACAAKIARVQQIINDAADKRIAEATEAAKAESPTPSTPAELVALCQKSPTCRDKKP